MDTVILIDVCRTCGAEDGIYGIFSEDGLKMQLAERINAYLPISVSMADLLPLALCHLCVERLESVHQLVASCLDTDQRLRQLHSAQDQVLETDRLEADMSLEILETENEMKDEKTHQVEINTSGFIAPNIYVVPPMSSIGPMSKDRESELVVKRDGFLCNGCNVWFRRQENFVHHQLRCPFIQTYTCALCNYTASDKSDLSAHTKQHRVANCNTQHVCPVCDRVLSTKTSLKLHMRTHSGERPYVCHSCGRSFAQKNALQYHEKTHTTVKSYHCRFCRKGFNGKLVLETHERIHTGERPYHCIVCGAMFRCLANLRQHQLIHDEYKPFQCPLCDKSFRRQEKVRIHLRTHTGERPYNCPYCGRGFAQRGDMQKHTLIHEPFKQKHFQWNKPVE